MGALILTSLLFLRIKYLVRGIIGRAHTKCVLFLRIKDLIGGIIGRAHINVSLIFKN